MDSLLMKYEKTKEKLFEYILFVLVGAVILGPNGMVIVLPLVT